MITTVQSRRGFLVGAASLVIAAPAIVRAGSLMPVKAMRLLSVEEIVNKIINQIGIIEPLFDWDMAISGMMEIQKVPDFWLRSAKYGRALP